jgi:hypothetical protein
VLKRLTRRIVQTVQDFDLPFIQHRHRLFLPEAGFGLSAAGRLKLLCQSEYQDRLRQAIISF